MRIISGTHKRRQFHIPKNLNVRPTTDFAKEALFNIVQHRVDLTGKKALDLFGGSGSVSYEFASRGCAEVFCVEKNFRCCAFIRKTSVQFGFESVRLIKTDVFSFLSVCSGMFDIIFADPPFRLKNIERIPSLVFAHNLLAKDGILIVEHPQGGEMNFSALPQYRETRKYGTINFSIFGNEKLSYDYCSIPRLV